MSMGKRSLIVTTGLAGWYSLLVGWAYLVFDTNMTAYFSGLPAFLVGFILLIIGAVFYKTNTHLSRWYGLQLFPVFVVLAVMGTMILTLGVEVGVPTAAAVTVVMWPVYLFLTVLTAMLIHGIQKLSIRKLNQDEKSSD